MHICGACRMHVKFAIINSNLGSFQFLCPGIRWHGQVPCETYMVDIDM